jgi:hypothetical protein
MQEDKPSNQIGFLITQDTKQSMKESENGWKKIKCYKKSRTAIKS